MALTATARADALKGDSCPLIRIVPERMPDMNMPRSGHNIFYVNGELTVTGGHTTHFVPTPTAEYLADGKWHQMPMAYSHDDGFAVVLHSGEVLIGGGHEEPLGIGQTFMLERYHSLTHTFEGFGSLDRRRALANATQIADGRVIISGNNFADDAIACYDGRSQVQHVKDAKQERDLPYILPIAHDDAIILGPRNIRASMHDTVWADRLEGEAFRVPLLEQWKLLPTDQPFSCMACFIGDEQKGDYSYLLTATNESGQLAIILATNQPDNKTTTPNHSSPSSPISPSSPSSSQAPLGLCFSLLPTVCPIPMQGPYGPVFYKGPVVVDSKRQRGYVMGVDSLFHRQYVLAVDYGKRPAALTLYHTDSIEHATITIPIVTPDGDLILAGGIPCDNYKPLATAWRYHFATPLPAVTASTGWNVWLWVVLAVVVIAAIVIAVARAKRASNLSRDSSLSRDTRNTSPTSTPTLPQQLGDNELLLRICRLMDNEQLYLRNDLKVQDVAVLVGTNSSYVSECINSGSGQSFSQFVNTYRVRHAQDLLRRQPNVKTATIAAESGFTTEASFFRNFKAVTGMTPRVWLGQEVKQP